MVGIKKFKLILGIFIPILNFSLMSQNIFAANLNLSTYAWYFYNGSTEQWSSEWDQYGSPNRTGYNLQLGPSNNLRYLRVKTNNVTPSGNYAAVNFRFNVIFAVPHGYGRRWQFRPDMLNITSSNIGNFSYIPQNTSIDVIRTDWEEWHGTQYCTNSNPCDMTTYTIMGSYYLSNIDQTAGPLQITIGGVTPFWQSLSDQYISTRVYLESSSMSVDFTTTIDNSLLQYQITQNDIIINQNQATQNKMVDGFNDINNTLEEQNDREQQGIDNIENQSSSDIQGSENGQTTSLINVITGFIGAFSSINATNCNLTLEFPNYAGGSRVVNICSGKEKAPRIVEIGSSLLLICVFVPLAYVLISMIYNEIRSWTNG